MIKIFRSHFFGYNRRRSNIWWQPLLLCPFFGFWTVMFIPRSVKKLLFFFSLRERREKKEPFPPPPLSAQRFFPFFLFLSQKIKIKIKKRQSLTPPKNHVQSSFGGLGFSFYWRKPQRTPEKIRLTRCRNEKQVKFFFFRVGVGGLAIGCSVGGWRMSGGPAELWYSGGK